MFVLAAHHALAQPGLSRIVLRGATVITATDAPPAIATIVISGDRIEQVLPGTATVDTAGARVFDLDGKTIIPGLIDMHVHYRDWMPQLLIAHGITSIRDLGNPTEWILAQREGIQDGKIFGPRIFASGNMLNAPPKLRPHHTPIENPAAARERVAELARQGVDLIKVYIRITPDLLQAVTAEAHAHGLRVAGHLTVTNAEQAAKAGIDSLEHGTGITASVVDDPKAWIDKDLGMNGFGVTTPDFLMALANINQTKASQLIRLLVAEDVAVAPNFVTVARGALPRRADYRIEDFLLLQEPGLSYLPDNIRTRVLEYSRWEALDVSHRDQMMQGFKNYLNFIRDFHRAGGMVLAESDTSSTTLAGSSFLRELEVLTLAGLTPLDAIVAATRAPAKWLGKESSLGSIEAGKLADLVVLDANPLTDIRNIRRINMVMKGGLVMDHRYRAAYANPLPRPIPDTAEGNPLAALSELSPVIVTEGAADQAIEITGRGFMPTSVVIFDGIRIPTQYRDATRLAATVPARLLSRVGTFSVRVWNPPPAGGESSPLYFMIKFNP